MLKKIRMATNATFQLSKKNTAIVNTLQGTEASRVSEFASCLNIKKELPLETDSEVQRYDDCHDNSNSFSDGEVEEKFRIPVKMVDCCEIDDHLTVKSEITDGCAEVQDGVSGKSFSFSSSLDKQACFKSGDRIYSCKYCSKTFKYWNDKRSHEHIHVGQKTYSCAYCDKTFHYSSNKKVHERTHTGEKPYACNYCKRTFAFLSSKQVHERTHTGEKPFSCCYCGKSFAQIGTKNIHEQRVHSGEKPFSFVYKTSQKAILDEFRKPDESIEKPHSCDFCDETFRKICDKYSHEEIHSEMNRVSCNYCQETFSCLVDMKEHELFHTPEGKPSVRKYGPRTYTRKKT